MTKRRSRPRNVGTPPRHATSAPRDEIGPIGAKAIELMESLKQFIDRIANNMSATPSRRRRPAPTSPHEVHRSESSHESPTARPPHVESHTATPVATEALSDPIQALPENTKNPVPQDPFQAPATATKEPRSAVIVRGGPEACTGCTTFDCVDNAVEGSMESWYAAAHAWFEAHGLFCAEACPRHGKNTVRMKDSTGVTVCGCHTKGDHNKCRRRLNDFAPWTSQRLSAGHCLRVAFQIAMLRGQKDGITCSSLARNTYVHIESLWARAFKLHQRRFPAKFNRCQVDETYVGKRKYHRGRRQRTSACWYATVVEVTADNTASRVRVKRVHKRTKEIMHAFIADHTVGPRSYVTTDCNTAYADLSKYYRHLKVNHQVEYVNKETRATTNTVEGIHGLLKRMLKGWGGGKFGGKSQLDYRITMAAHFVTYRDWRAKLKLMFTTMAAVVEDLLDSPHDTETEWSSNDADTQRALGDSDESDSEGEHEEQPAATQPKRPQPPAEPPRPLGRPRHSQEERAAKAEKLSQKREDKRTSRTIVRARPRDPAAVLGEADDPFCPAHRSGVTYREAMQSLDDKQEIEALVVYHMMVAVVGSRATVLRPELFAANVLPSKKLDYESLPATGLILLPLHVHHHWVLLTWRRPVTIVGEKEERRVTITVYNSVRGSCGGEIAGRVAALSEWIKSRWKDVTHVVATGPSDPDRDEPQQKPGSNDCGLFVINYAARAVGSQTVWTRQKVRRYLILKSMTSEEKKQNRDRSDEELFALQAVPRSQDSGEKDSGKKHPKKAVRSRVTGKKASKTPAKTPRKGKSQTTRVKSQPKTPKSRQKAPRSALTSQKKSVPRKKRVSK